MESAEAVDVLADKPDNRILECAKESRADLMITEDRAMRRLRIIRKSLGVWNSILGTAFAVPFDSELVKQSHRQDREFVLAFSKALLAK